MVCIERVKVVLNSWQEKNLCLWENIEKNAIGLLENSDRQRFYKTLEFDPHGIKITVRLTEPHKLDPGKLSCVRRWMLNVNDIIPAKFVENEDTGSEFMLGIVGMRIEANCFKNIHELEIELEMQLKKLNAALTKYADNLYQLLCEGST